MLGVTCESKLVLGPGPRSTEEQRGNNSSPFEVAAP